MVPVAMGSDEHDLNIESRGGKKKDMLVEPVTPSRPEIEQLRTQFMELGSTPAAEHSSTCE